MNRGKLIKNWDEFFSSLGKNVALVGGGGKTSLIKLIEAKKYADGEEVLVTLTTRLGRDQLAHLKRYEAKTLDEALFYSRLLQEGERVFLAGAPERGLKDVKYSALPLAYFEVLKKDLGPKSFFLIEADGSAALALKAHRANEPVLPPLKELSIIAVVGLSALLKPWPEALHRPEIYELFQKLPSQEKPLKPIEIAEFINKAWRRFSPDLIFLNQADLLIKPAHKLLAADLADALCGAGWNVFLASVQEALPLYFKPES